MEIYNTEEEQVEALKRWWKENGKALVIGVVLGGAALIGYRGWDAYQTGHAEKAAEIYEQVEGALQRGDAAAIEAGALALAADYASTPYAPLSALALAMIKVEAGDKSAARSQLEWIETNSGQPEVVNVARLRLARLLIDMGDADAALARLEGIEGGFVGVVEELRGDAFRLKGEYAAARDAYVQALIVGASNQVLLQMKLDDLGPADAPQ